MLQTHVLHNALYEEHSLCCLVVSCKVVTVTEVTAGYKHSVCSVSECLQHKERVDTSGTHHTDDSDVRRVLGTGGTPPVAPAVGTPVADEPDTLRFPLISNYCSPPRKNASIGARICGLVKCCMRIAPPGQKPPHVPQPLHLAAVTLMTVLPSSLMIIDRAE